MRSPGRYGQKRVTAGGASDIVVDLDQVTLLDANGISALVDARNLAAQYGFTCLVTIPHGIVHRVLAITGVLRALAEPSQPYLLP